MTTNWRHTSGNIVDVSTRDRSSRVFKQQHNKKTYHMLKLLCSIFLFLHLSSRRRVFSSFLIIFSHPSSPLDTFTVVARSRYINWVWCESLCCCCRRLVQMLFFFRFCSPFPSFSFYCLMNLEEERILRSNVHFHSAGLLVWWSLSSSTHSRSSSQVRCHIVSRPSGIFRIKSDTDPHFSSWDFATYPIHYSNNNITVLVIPPRFVVRQSENIFPISGKEWKNEYSSVCRMFVLK